MKASEELNNGTALTEVHEILEHVKKPLIDMRNSLRIDFYPDYLDAYHSVMEEILGFLADKTATELSEEDLNAVEVLVTEGIERWNTIQEAPFDRALFGFNETKTAGLMKNIEEGKAESMKFHTLVHNGSKEIMLKESAVLKSFYTKVFLQFGNFVRLQS